MTTASQGQARDQNVEPIRIRSWGAIALDLLLRAVPIVLLSLALIATGESLLVKVLIAAITLALLIWVVRPSLARMMVVDQDGIRIVNRSSEASVKLSWTEIDKISVDRPVGSETIPLIEFHAGGERWAPWGAVELGRRKREQLVYTLSAFANDHGITCWLEPRDLDANAAGRAGTVASRDHRDLPPEFRSNPEARTTGDGQDAQ